MLRKDFKQATSKGGEMLNHIAFNMDEMMSNIREEDKQKILNAMNAEAAKKRRIIRNLMNDQEEPPWKEIMRSRKEETTVLLYAFNIWKRVITCRKQIDKEEANASRIEGVLTPRCEPLNSEGDMEETKG